MNILPKKRWHVRTKENIARVRRDEAKAAEEEKERLRRVALAEQEFRTSILRKKAAERRECAVDVLSTEHQQHDKPTAVGLISADKDTAIVAPTGHINFFQHLENGEKTGGDNEEYLREKREEKEKYEKSIGYLTYLGQGSREETKEKAWFETIPVDRSGNLKEEVNFGEVRKKTKDFEDPLNIVNKFISEQEKRDSVSKAPIGHLIDKSTTQINPVCLYKPVESENVGVSSKIFRRSSNCSSSSNEDNTHHRRKKHKKDKKRKKDDKKGSKKCKKSHSPSKPKKMHKKRARTPQRESSDEDAEAAAVKKIQLERMRAERLQRERVERQRADQLLRKLRGEEEAKPRAHEQEPKLKQRYNAQFNPYLAKQNYRDK